MIRVVVLSFLVFLLIFTVADDIIWFITGEPYEPWIKYVVALVIAMLRAIEYVVNQEGK